MDVVLMAPFVTISVIGSPSSSYIETLLTAFAGPQLTPNSSIFSNATFASDIIGGDHPGVPDFLRVSNRDSFAEINDGYAVRNPHNEIHVVFDHKNSHAVLIDFRKYIDQKAGFLRVHARREIGRAHV